MALAVVRIWRTASSWMPSSSSTMSSSVSIGHADLADLAVGERMVGVEPVLRRQVEGDREAALPGGEEVADASVRGRRRRPARIHAHHPRLAQVSGAVDAARERERTRGG